MITRRLTLAKRQLKWMLQMPYRLATAKERALPDFLIIGEASCGTSSMHAYLAQHPQVFRAMRKELRFFGNKPYKGENYYRSYFPLRKTIEPDGLTGEASASYLRSPVACESIKKMLPDVKLICLLRNPTERALSHYFRKRLDNYEALPILEALQIDMAGDYSKRKRRLRDRLLGGRSHRYNYSYLRDGIYVRNLERYWEHFKREQILVLNSETFFHDPEATMRRVFKYLEIDPHYKVKDLRVRARVRNNRRADGEVYAFLDNYYRPYNQELYEALGEDFGW